MQSGEIVAGRFEILSHAGSGGMGVVYKARDLRTGQAVALKLLHGHTGAHADRFAREAQLLSELRHPGIVRFVGSGVAAHGDGFIVMEWLEGQSLAARLERGPLSVPEAIQLGALVADALRPAHERGIVHRDLKPQNLFLEGGAIDRVKVLDFGIARILEPGQRLTVTGQMIGTPGYMSPEQARGASTVDARTDVYALGCVLYCALNGRPLFYGEDAVSVLVRVNREEAPRISLRRPDVPPALDDLLARMLAIDPARRPAHAAAVLAELAVIGGFQTGETALVSSSSSPRAIGRAGSFSAMAPSSFTAAPPPASWVMGPTVQVASSAPAGGAGVAPSGSAPSAFGSATTIPAGKPAHTPASMSLPYTPAPGSFSAPAQAGYAPVPPLPAMPPPPLITPPAAPAGGGRATVLVMLGAVGALLVVGLLLVGAAAMFWFSRPSSPAGGVVAGGGTTAYCPGERCLPLRLSEPLRVDAVALLPEARKVARGLEPGVELVMLTVITSHADGTVNTSNQRQFLHYHFQDGKQGSRFYLWVNGDRWVMNHVSPVPSQLALPDPSCSLAAVLRAAGITEAMDTTVTLVNSGPPVGAFFSVSSPSGSSMIDPRSCTARRNY